MDISDRQVPMPEEQPRASEKFRAYLGGELIRGGLIAITVGEGMVCTLDGRVVNILEMVHDPSSGEIDEIYLAEVQE